MNAPYQMLEKWLGTYADDISHDAYHKLLLIQREITPQPDSAALINQQKATEGEQSAAGERVDLISSVEREAINSTMSNARYYAGDVDDVAPPIENNEAAYWSYHTYHGIRKLLALIDSQKSGEGDIASDILQFGIAYEVDGIRVHPSRICVHTAPQPDSAAPGGDARIDEWIAAFKAHLLSWKLKPCIVEALAKEEREEMAAGDCDCLNETPEDVAEWELDDIVQAVRSREPFTGYGPQPRPAALSAPGGDVEQELRGASGRADEFSGQIVLQDAIAALSAPKQVGVSDRWMYVANRLLKNEHVCEFRALVEAIIDAGPQPKQIDTAVGQDAIIAMLVEVARAAHRAMDDAEGFDDGTCTLDAAGCSALSAALDSLESLPEIDDGYVRDGWCRAKDLLAASPQAAPGPVEAKSDPTKCYHKFPMDPRRCVLCGWDFRNGEPVPVEGERQSTLVKWWNNCNETVPAALRFLAEHDRPDGGEQRYNSLHLHQLAGEIERMAKMPMYTTPPPEQPAVELEEFREAVELLRLVSLSGKRDCERHNTHPHDFDRSLEKANHLLALIDGAKAGPKYRDEIGPRGKPTGYIIRKGSAADARNGQPAKEEDE